MVKYVQNVIYSTFPYNSATKTLQPSKQQQLAVQVANQLAMQAAASLNELPRDLARAASYKPRLAPQLFKYKVATIQSACSCRWWTS